MVPRTARTSRMHCKSCNESFCLLCLGPWSTHKPHAQYRCNHYDEEHPQMIAILDHDPSQAPGLYQLLQIRQLIWPRASTRYLFHMARFLHHTEGFRDAQALLDRIDGE